MPEHVGHLSHGLCRADENARELVGDSTVLRQQFGFEPIRSRAFGISDRADAPPENDDRDKARASQNSDGSVLGQAVSGDRLHLLLRLRVQCRGEQEWRH
ncbi:hypothetical protein [Nocardia aurea]|uniref:hypothetical protein n=1 Tax=Nocardia aurea TaxID=2144174 RepID=UPI0033BEF0BC